MIEIKGMLIIGGNARNIGKTTLACRIIKEFSARHKIIGLKVITHSKGDEQFHGTKERQLNKKFIITEEKNKDISKDTARMLKAGASKVYMIRTKEMFLGEAISEFFQEVNPESIFVCESNSLNNIVRAGVYFMVRFETAAFPKSSARDTEKLADRIIDTNGKFSVFEHMELKLKLVNNQWVYKE